jgi:phage gp36-like protein
MASLCDPADLVKYLPAAVVNLATPTQQQSACDDATEEAYSYMRGRYAVPFSAWGNDVRRYTAWIACYLLCDAVGFVAVGPDKLITERYYQAVGWPDRAGTGWFPGVQRQAIHPNVTPATPTPGDPVHDLPQVISQPLRGWTNVRNGRPVVG